MSDKLKLTILLDKAEPWFQYIWEQFVTINGLKTPFQIRTYSETFSSVSGDTGALVIEYGTRQRFPGSLYIPKRTKFRTDDFVWLREDLPVYQDTMSDEKSGIPYDIFFNSFVRLSRLDEWEAERDGKKILSYAFRHPCRDNKVWLIPVVNVFFNELESTIIKRYPCVEFAQPVKPFIEYSHDVDYIKKTLPLRLKRTFFDFANAFRLLAKGRVGDSMDRLTTGMRFCIRPCDYWFFDYWESLEKSHNARSVFYIYAHVAGKNPKTWLLDPSYDVRKDKKVRQQLAHLVSEGFEIGLHGSFNTAVNGPLLKKEKNTLEEALGRPIAKTRQHWLHYVERFTPYIHEELQLHDSTLGWNDQLGFRSGCASRYNPYDHKNQKPFRFLETPQIIMDSTIFEYHVDDIEGAAATAANLLMSLSKWKNAAVSVSWHQRSCSKDYGWHKTYERMLDVV